MQLLIATKNLGKRREIEAALKDLPLDIVGLDAIPDLPDVVEDGRTFAANASKKALALARASGMLTLADDSGLVVDALGGEPGVHSARYAGPRATNDENNRHLLEALKGFTGKQRSARFVCVIAVASPAEVLFTIRGECAGTIIEEPRGKNGFGYDPLFLYPLQNLTFAEMPAAEKNRISHRAKALAQTKNELERLVKMGLM